MNGLEPLIPIAFFFSLAAVLILRGPLGKALAERLSGRRRDDEDGEQLRGDVDELRGQLAEMQERLDFAERLLTQQREAGKLPDGGR